MDTQNKSSLCRKDASFLKQPAQREANPAALTHGHTADSSMSMLSNSHIYRNVSILDQTSNTDLQSVNWCLMGTCCILRSITFHSKKNNLISENELLGEVAFSDNSLWGQQVWISFKRKDAAQLHASWGTALLAAPPIQFPPKQKRFSGFITVLIYQYLIENTLLILLLHQNSPSPHIKNVSKQSVYRKQLHRYHMKAENG